MSYERLPCGADAALRLAPLANHEAESEVIEVHPRGDGLVRLRRLPFRDVIAGGRL